ncbi:uroporphyrinogen-III synthase [Salaquimonas pukyongi]|uniref:uroporphyrinogen-III synthase n=1 Tax=Salaquimonas pukyongi TaxID=2712698 RepID=UPI00096BB7A1|nr:uroporphyrinogen-III synthase [Salaquimonas pukyongi]
MKVLLTRRPSDNARMVPMLKSAGLEAVQLPLIELEDTGHDLPGGRFDFSVFTSAAAVEVLSARNEGRLLGVPAYAVGPRTAGLLKENAYLDVRQSSGDVENLAARISADFGGRSGICGIYPCGEKRARDLSAMVEPAGIALESVETYRLKEKEVSRDALRASLNGAEGGAVAVFSTESGRRLLELVQRHSLEKALANLSAAALSEGIAETLDARLFQNIHVAERPDAEAMVKLLAELDRQH